MIRTICKLTNSACTCFIAVNPEADVEFECIYQRKNRRKGLYERRKFDDVSYDELPNSTRVIQRVYTDRRER